MAERKPTCLNAGARINHDYRAVKKNLFGLCLADLMPSPILRGVRLIPLESFDILKELRQESHNSVYAYHIHRLKA